MILSIYVHANIIKEDALAEAKLTKDAYHVHYKVTVSICEK